MGKVKAVSAKKTRLTAQSLTWMMAGFVVAGCMGGRRLDDAEGLDCWHSFCSPPCNQWTMDALIFDDVSTWPAAGTPMAACMLPICMPAVVFFRILFRKGVLAFVSRPLAACRRFNLISTMGRLLYRTGLRITLSAGTFVDCSRTSLQFEFDGIAQRTFPFPFSLFTIVSVTAVIWCCSCFFGGFDFFLVFMMADGVCCWYW